jgi:hypothetical protein
MANYLIRTCDNIGEYVVDSGSNTITVGLKYYFTFTGETLPFCGEVISVDLGPIDDTIDTVVLYTNCLECLVDQGFSAAGSACSGETEYGIPVTEFTNLPIVGEYYKFCDGNEFCFCFRFLGFQFTASIRAFYNGGPFLDCDCGQEPPRSANTESLICEICCDCGATGSTITQITPPHPVWSDGYGTQVTQLNMITLGGPNGLNN